MITRLDWDFLMNYNVLKFLDCNVNDVRGQDYDNGSNMKENHQGVQKWFHELNLKALYMRCACHSLNLTFYA